jgi:hypothetical protein
MGRAGYPGMKQGVLTDLFTSWSEVLEKLVVIQVVKKSAKVYGTRIFIIGFKRARRFSLS